MDVAPLCSQMRCIMDAVLAKSQQGIANTALLFFGVKWRRGQAVLGGGGRGYFRRCVSERSPLQGLRHAGVTVCSHGALFLN